MLIETQSDLAAEAAMQLERISKTRPHKLAEFDHFS
jgi:hypothetical protein